MKKILTLILLFACCVNSIITSAETVNDKECKWELKKSENNIKVYYRKRKDETIEVKVKAKYNSDFKKVVKTIKNTRNYPKWVYKCKKTEYLYGKDGKKYLRTVTEIPWPMQDRDAIAVQVPMKKINDRTYELISYSTPKAIPEYDGFTRQEKSDVCWRITKLNNKQTQIDYTIKLKFSDGIPDFLLESITTSGPYETFSNLRGLLNKI